MAENGGAAFPLEHHSSCKGCHLGMSLRDYFASRVLCSLVAKHLTAEYAVKDAYHYANLMLKEREKFDQ